MYRFLPKYEADTGKSLPSREAARERGRPVSADYEGLESAYHMHIQWYLKPQDSTRRFLAGGNFSTRRLRSDRDTNDTFAHCFLIFYFLAFKFSNFVCPSEFHPLIWFFCKNSFRKKKNIRKTTQNALAPSIFIVLSIVLNLGTPLLHTQAQNTLLQNF